MAKDLIAGFPEFSVDLSCKNLIFKQIFVETTPRKERIYVWPL